MQPIGTMLRRTSHQVRRQQELLALHARKASTSFASETKTVSREIASAVRGEADAWSKYVRDTGAALTGALAPNSLERTVLVRASFALRALDARLRERIQAIESRRRARSKSKRSNGAAKLRAKRQPVVAHAH